MALEVAAAAVVHWSHCAASPVDEALEDAAAVAADEGGDGGDDDHSPDSRWTSLSQESCRTSDCAATADAAAAVADTAADPAADHWSHQWQKCWSPVSAVAVALWSVQHYFAAAVGQQRLPRRRSCLPASTGDLNHG